MNNTMNKYRMPCGPLSWSGTVHMPNKHHTHPTVEIALCTSTVGAHLSNIQLVGQLIRNHQTNSMSTTTKKLHSWVPFYGCCCWSIGELRFLGMHSKNIRGTFREHSGNIGGKWLGRASGCSASWGCTRSVITFKPCKLKIIARVHSLMHYQQHWQLHFIRATTVVAHVVRYALSSVNSCY